MTEQTQTTPPTISDGQVIAFLTAIHEAGRHVPNRSVGDWLEAGRAHLEIAARILAGKPTS